MVTEIMVYQCFNFLPYCNCNLLLNKIVIFLQLMKRAFLYCCLPVLVAIEFWQMRLVLLVDAVVRSLRNLLNLSPFLFPKPVLRTLEVHWPSGILRKGLIYFKILNIPLFYRRFPSIQSFYNFFRIFLQEQFIFLTFNKSVFTVALFYNLHLA